MMMERFPIPITSLTDQSTDIDDQVERLENFVQMRRQSMIDSFVAMESSQQKSTRKCSLFNLGLDKTLF